MEIIAKNSNEAMKKMLKELKKSPEVTVRGLSTKELINVNLTIKNVDSDNGIITKHLPANQDYIKKEINLYMSGSNKLSEFKEIASFWEKISDDGKTVRSAYGYIMMDKHGFDQFDYCAKQLLKDTFSRKAVITFKTPYDKDTKDNVCTLSMQFLIRDGKLHGIVNMRSNDIYFGFRNDLPFFVYLMKRMQVALKEEGMWVELGEYHHNAASLHAYKNTVKKLGW